MSAESHILNFEVSAPCKVILHGEHSVVYGKPAIACVIGKRSFLSFIENDAEVIEFNFKNIEIIFRIDISELNQLLKMLKGPVGSNDHDLIIQEIKKFLEPLLIQRSILTERVEKTMISVLYLLCGILLNKSICKLNKGFNLKLTTEVRIGSGLGSSASFGVCIASAFILLSRHMISSILSEPFNILSNEQKTEISNWAFISERIMHGSPSGIDNTVCTFGSIIKFAKGLNMEQMEMMSPVHVMLVDTKVNRNTANIVAKVAEFKNQFPKIIEHILNAMEEVVLEATTLYQSIVNSSGDEFKKLQALFQLNNNLLKAIGVSHPKLEYIFSIAYKHGFSSKLTGAGGGGYALVILPNHYKDLSQYHDFCNELTKNDYDWFDTTIGGSGVEIINPYFN